KKLGEVEVNEKIEILVRMSSLAGRLMSEKLGEKQFYLAMDTCLHTLQNELDRNSKSTVENRQLVSIIKLGIAIRKYGNTAWEREKNQIFRRYGIARNEKIAPLVKPYLKIYLGGMVPDDISNIKSFLTHVDKENLFDLVTLP